MDRFVIGQTLKNLRGRKSRKEVALALHISKSALAMYERGERIPRDEVKVRMAQYYGRPVQEIFFTQKSTKSAF